MHQAAVPYEWWALLRYQRIVHIPSLCECIAEVAALHVLHAAAHGVNVSAAVCCYSYRYMLTHQQLQKH